MEGGRAKGGRKERANKEINFEIPPKRLYRKNIKYKYL